MTKISEMDRLGESPAPSTAHQASQTQIAETILALVQESSPEPMDTYTLLRLRHGASIGRLIAALGNNPYHPDAPFGTSHSLQRLLKELAEKHGSHGVPLRDARQASELLLEIKGRLKNAKSSPSTQPAHDISNETLPRLLAALGAEPAQEESQGEDLLIRLLKTDPGAKDNALHIDPETHPYLYEILLMALLSEDVEGFVKTGMLLPNAKPKAQDDGVKSVTQKDAQASKSAANRLEEEVQEDRQESPEERKDRLARQLAERAAYVIPMLCAQAADLHAAESTAEPHIDAVSAVHASVKEHRKK